MRLYLHFTFQTIKSTRQNHLFRNLMVRWYHENHDFPKDTINYFNLIEFSGGYINFYLRFNLLFKTFIII